VTRLQLRGKIAVVTGASAGIGEATARALAAEGMTVVATARRTERLEQLAAGDARIVPRTVDVTSDEDVVALAKFVTEELGACHVLVNNAGTSFGRQLRGPADLDDFHRTMDVNLYGTVRAMAHFAPLLFASAPARVVNVASVIGKVGLGTPGYAASKFAVVGLSETVRLDWQRRGVSVTQLNPGFIRTEQFPQDGLMKNPLGRLIVGRPELVAAAVIDAAQTGPAERTVPRWYRAVPVVRHVAAPLYWAAVGRGRR